MADASIAARDPLVTVEDVPPLVLLRGEALLTTPDGATERVEYAGHVSREGHDLTPSQITLLVQSVQHFRQTVEASGVWRGPTGETPFSRIEWVTPRG